MVSGLVFGQQPASLIAMLPNAKSVIGRIVRLPLRLIPKDREVTIKSGPNRGFYWITGSSDHGCWLGNYESQKANLFASRIKRAMCVWDCGAHVGYYSLIASRRTEPLGQVYAFEPLPRNLKHLTTHSVYNNRRNIHIVKKAVSDHEGEAWFNLSNSHSMGRIAAQGAVRVETIRLDDFLTEDKQPPDVIKMDIEGGEFSALCGAIEVLKKYHPVIFLATHGPEVHNRCVELLKSLDYSISELGSPDELLCV
jgi:FkbM family methyltransferase